MTDFMAPKKNKDPEVLDIREGWMFGYSGKVIKTALFEKVAKLETASKDILNQLEREVGDDARNTVALMVAMHSPTMNEKARYISALCDRVVELEQERARLARAAKGFADTITYVISLEDMETMGL
jgi:hypothetical protein